MKRVIFFRIIPVILIVIFGSLFAVQVVAFIAAGEADMIIKHPVMLSFVILHISVITTCCVIMKKTKIE